MFFSSCQSVINSSYITFNNFSIAFDDLYDISYLNCTSYIPSQVLALMTHYSRLVHANDSTYDQMIPTHFLEDCLLNSPYDKRVSALYYMQRPRFTIGFGLNQVLSLTFEGVLSSAVTLTLTWNERRLMWNESSDIPHWKWPSHADISPSKLWLPVYFVHNCPTASCAISIDNYSEIDVSNNGSISQLVMTVIKSTCHLDLTLFPFDQQNCSIYIDFDNSIPFTFYTVVASVGQVMYYEECDEWLVTSLSFANESGYSYQFQMNTSTSDWVVSEQLLNNNTLRAQLTLVRTSSSDVYNLLAPVKR